MHIDDRITLAYMQDSSRVIREINWAVAIPFTHNRDKPHALGTWNPIIDVQLSSLATFDMAVLMTILPTPRGLQHKVGPYASQ